MDIIINIDRKDKKLQYRAQAQDTAEHSRVCSL